MWFGNAVFFGGGGQRNGGRVVALERPRWAIWSNFLVAFPVSAGPGWGDKLNLLDAVGLAPGAVVGGLAPLLGDQHPTGTGLEPGPQLIPRAVMGWGCGWGVSCVVLVLLLVWR